MCIHTDNHILSYLCRQGGLRGEDPQITLTAFVLIALAEAKQAGFSCSDPNVNLEVKKMLFFPLFYPLIPDKLNYLLIFSNLLLFFQSAMSKTAEYLKRVIVLSARRPYTVAIVSYALVLAQKNPQYSPLSYLMRAAAPGKPHRSFSFRLCEPRSTRSDRLPFRSRPLA